MAIGLIEPAINDCRLTIMGKERKGEPTEKKRTEKTGGGEREKRRKDRGEKREKRGRKKRERKHVLNPPQLAALW